MIHFYLNGQEIEGLAWKNPFAEFSEAFESELFQLKASMLKIQLYGRGLEFPYVVNIVRIYEGAELLFSGYVDINSIQTELKANCTKFNVLSWARILSDVKGRFRNATSFFASGEPVSTIGQAVKDMMEAYIRGNSCESDFSFEMNYSASILALEGDIDCDIDGSALGENVYLHTTQQHSTAGYGEIMVAKRDDAGDADSWTFGWLVNLVDVDFPEGRWAENDMDGNSTTSLRAISMDIPERTAEYGGNASDYWRRTITSFGPFFAQSEDQICVFFVKMTQYAEHVTAYGQTQVNTFKRFSYPYLLINRNGFCCSKGELNKENTSWEQTFAGEFITEETNTSPKTIAFTEEVVHLVDGDRSQFSGGSFSHDLGVYSCSGNAIHVSSNGTLEHFKYQYEKEVTLATLVKDFCKVTDNVFIVRNEKILFKPRATLAGNPVELRHVLDRQNKRIEKVSYEINTENRFFKAADNALSNYYTNAYGNQPSIETVTGIAFSRVRILDTFEGNRIFEARNKAMPGFYEVELKTYV